MPPISAANPSPEILYPPHFPLLETQEKMPGVFPWENWEDSQKQWISQGISPDSTIEGIIYPQTPEELAAVVVDRNQKNLPILPCGALTKLRWGGCIQGHHLLVSTRHLNRLIEHAVGDLTVTVEAGMKFAELQKILGAAGQFLALDPAYPEAATMGGIVATADTGSLRHRYRGIRDMLLGISFVRADGKIAKAGGRVVKNVAGYDLMKLLTGSFGTLGIISQMTFRVYPLLETSGTVVLTGAAHQIKQATQTLLASALTPTAVDLFSSSLVKKLNLGQGIGLGVKFQSISQSVQEQSQRWLGVGEKLGLTGSYFQGQNEADLWQQLKQQIWASISDTTRLCKIGVIPSEAVATLAQLQPEIGLIHAASGLGMLRLNAVPAEVIEERRRWCESKGGFLTLLEAPLEIKRKLEVWGYTGNALNLMQQLKQQFDPKNILSPHRFVGGI